MSIEAPNRANIPTDLSDDVEMELDNPRYKHQAVQEELLSILESNDSDHNKVIAKLIELGVVVYIVTYDSTDLFRDLIEITIHASNHNPRYASNNRCCLYKDSKGRVFNVVVSGGTEGLAGTYDSNFISFSGFEATSAAVVLFRSFACLDQDTGLKPAYLSLILGLVLHEEISMLWPNVCLQVQGTPSIGAFALQNIVIADWPRKVLIFVLAMASAATGSEKQKYITLLGVIIAVYILFTNLGCRAWKNMCLKKQGYMGCFGAPLASFSAFLVGITFPYLGFREVESGGQTALENTIISAIFVALIFIVSDFDQVQKFILFGSEKCNQDIINRIVGAWFAFSLLACVCFYKRIIPEREKKYQSEKGSYQEPFLIESEASPVGHKVPHLADFYVDPALRSTPFRITSESFDLILGVVLALAIGGVIIAMSFSQVDDEFFSEGLRYLQVY